MYSVPTFPFPIRCHYSSFVLLFLFGVTHLCVAKVDNPVEVDMTTSCAEKFSISPSPTESTSDTDVVPDLQVWWDPCPETDPQNPRNWPATVKWANILTLSVISFLVCVLSSLVSYHFLPFSSLNHLFLTPTPTLTSIRTY